MTSRVTEILSKIPIVTVGLLLLNCSIHGIVFLFYVGLNNYSISAAQVLRGEYYRIVSAAFTHNGMMHIFMNMSSLLQLGASLEAQFGSMQFAFLTLWSTVLIGIVYVLLSWCTAVIMMDARQLWASGVGFSGVLFCYAVIEANHTSEATRSLYGICNIPSKLYPFVLLVLLQIIIPNISWLGHLSGVIIGLVSISPAMHLCLTSDAFMEHLETKVFPFATLSRQSSYVRCTNKSLIISSSSGICATVYSGIRLICTHVWNVIAVVLHIVGFPTDRLCGAIGTCLSPLYAAVGTCCRPREQLLQEMPVSSSTVSNYNNSDSLSGTGASRGRILGGSTTSNSLSTAGSGANRGTYAPLVQEV